MSHPETQYLDLLAALLEAPERPDRTGTGTRSLFGARMEFDPIAGFPLLTTKKLPFKAIVAELLWFLRGDTNVTWLQEQGVHIWDEWADPNGDLGPVYGRQWRSWAAPDGRIIDQIAAVLDSLRADPYGRRHLVSAWNPADLPGMALPPCHVLFQFYVEPDGALSCQLYQRSADAFLGLPFNIASYALLTCMVARTLGRPRGRFVWTGGDVHLYRNHEAQARAQLGRAPRQFPALFLPATPPARLEDWTVPMIVKGLLGYQPHPHIAAEVAV